MVEMVLSPTRRRMDLILGEPLFSKGELSSYLRAQEGAVDDHVRQTVSKSDLTKLDAELVQEMLPGARVTPLSVLFDDVEKNVAETRITVNDHFSGRVQIDGVRATRSFPFLGQDGLFDLRPNQWSTVLPYARVQANRIVIGIEGRPNDPDSLKQELDRQEKYLKDYVAWSSKQIEDHNAKLENLLAEAVARRRKHLTSLDDLASRI